jgi:hypothetical protein
MSGTLPYRGLTGSGPALLSSPSIALHPRAAEHVRSADYEVGRADAQRAVYCQRRGDRCANLVSGPKSGAEPLRRGNLETFYLRKSRPRQAFNVSNLLG